MPTAKVTKAVVTNRTPGMTIMDHVMNNIDIEAIVKANKSVFEKIIAAKIKGVIANYDWSDLLYDAIDSGRIQDIMRTRITSAIEETVLGGRRP